MVIYRGHIVPLNVEKIERKFQEFNSIPFTLREIYKVIDNLDNNKAPGRDTKCLGIEIPKICYWDKTSGYI